MHHIQRTLNKKHRISLLTTEKKRKHILSLKHTRQENHDYNKSKCIFKIYNDFTGRQRKSAFCFH